MSKQFCPSPRVLRASARGTLNRVDMQALHEHTETCPTCSAAMAGERRRLLFVRGGLVLLLVLAGAVGAFLLRARAQQSPASVMSPLERLAAAQPRDGRSLEARLTGLPWAPFQAVTRGAADDDRKLAARVVAAEITGNVTNDPSTVQAAALAYAVEGKIAPAVEMIERALRMKPSDARLRSDAAALLLAQSAAETGEEDLPVALAHADAALAIDPRAPEALFNRALIIERMGLRHHAVAAWKDYLAVDVASEWASEVRERMNALDRPSDGKTFAAARSAAEAASQRGDVQTVQTFVDAYRQLSRAWCEVETLAEWAVAEQEGRAGEAGQHLGFARSVGSRIGERSGERLLSEAVAAIEVSAGDTRQALARAHATYRQGRLSLRSRKADEAEPLLAESAAAFRAAASPMANVALYYRAVALFDQNQMDVARAELQRLSAQIAPAHRALAGSIQWQLGMCYLSTGDWSQALAAYEQAEAHFGALDENGNLGFVNALIADVYDVFADRERAWQKRIEAFQFLSDAGRDTRLHVTLGGAVRSELRSGYPDAAASMLKLAVAEAKNAAGPETVASSYATMATLRSASGDLAGAYAALKDARAAALSVPKALQDRANAAIHLAEAAIARNENPAHALTLLADAEQHYVKTGRRIWLPAVRLEQGRAMRRLGRDEESLRLWKAGIEELERQRASVTEAELRESIFDTGTDLFEETIDLMALRGLHDEALSYAETYRARTLLESVALRGRSAVSTMTWSAAVAELPDGTVVLEYAVLRDRLLIFCVQNGRLTTFTVPVTRERLQELVRTATGAVLDRASTASSVRPALAALYEVVIAPASAMLAGARMLIFVPDRFLQQVPFGGLVEPQSGRYLTETYPNAVAPGIRLLAELRRRPRQEGRIDALIVGNPATGGELASLPESEREARAIAGMYSHPALLVKGDATRTAFTRVFSTATTVHFAGHASTEPAKGAAAALAFAGEGRADHLYAHEIARTRPEATRMVVLAACDSLGKGKEHLETTGTLAHAFLAAGVPSVAGALWPIEDRSASALFRRFHRKWTGGLDAATSLREAQLALIASGDAALQHPRAWAGVEIVGNPWQLKR